VAVALSVGGLGAGCDSQGATADPAASFVGTWRYDMVTSVVQCPSSVPTNVPPNPNKTLARGATTALVDLSQSPLLEGVFCDFGFDVNAEATIATAHPGQTCVFPGGLDNITIDEPTDGSTRLWTFTLTSATTADELIQATTHDVIAGAVQSCVWTLQGKLTRVSKD
jgi:hypothetical protein